MSETILITASLRMEAPAALVRSQYRDIDHHIRNNVHPDISYRWEPAAPGERKIRTTFRILGMPQYDVSLLEDAPDGSFVIRYLEGTNAGMVLVHEFVPLDDGATEVRISANAPATLARTILGPLFKVGARQVMRKALREDKVDIEKGNYRPGIAAGNLARALAPLDAVIERGDAAAARAILGAGALLTAVDGAIDEAERDALATIAAKLGVDAAWAVDRQGELAKLATTDAIAARAREAGAELAARNVSEEGLVAASVAGLVSHGMSLGELEALRAIAAAARFPEDRLAPLIERADAALMTWTS
jgi:hypothetical protein